MPNSRPRTCSNRILSDYLIWALRYSPSPMTTTQLRQGAPLVAVPGSARPLPPSQEAIYRLLRSLASRGAVAAVTSANARPVWSAVADPAADRETAALNALFNAPCATDREPRVDPCRRRP